MSDWTKWYERARKAKEQSGKSDADLAAAITAETKRKAGRAQVNHFLTGKRDPTLSQFMVLCSEMGADPGQVLFGVAVLPSTDPKVAKVLRTDPRKKATYGMQEKRLKMRRPVLKARTKRRETA